MNDGLVRTTQCPLVTFSENQAQSLSPQFLSVFFFFYFCLQQTLGVVGVYLMRFLPSLPQLGNGSSACLGNRTWKLAQSNDTGALLQRLEIFYGFLSTGNCLGGVCTWFLVFRAQDGEVFSVQMATFFYSTEVVVFFAAAPGDAAERSTDDLALTAYQVSGFGYGFLQSMHPVPAEVHPLGPGGTRLVHPEFLGHLCFLFCFTGPPLPAASPRCGAILGARGRVALFPFGGPAPA